MCYIYIYIYICICVCIDQSLCVLCKSLFVLSNLSTDKTHVICVKPSVSMMPCCISHILFI